MEKLKKQIAGLGIAGALVGGAIGIEDTYHKDIYLKATNKMYSGMEYRQERKNIGERASIDKLNDYTDLQLYVEILNREKNKCDGKMYLVNNKQDIRSMVKKYDEDGCPK